MAYATASSGGKGYSGATASKGYGASSPASAYGKSSGVSNGYNGMNSSYTGPTSGKTGLEGLTSTSSNIPTVYGGNGMRGMGMPCMPSTTGGMPEIMFQSYSITRHADGSVTETYTIGSLPGMPPAGPGGMPGMTTGYGNSGMGMPGLPKLQNYTAPKGAYDKKDEKGDYLLAEMRKKADTTASKQSLNNFEKLMVFDPNSFVTSRTPFIGDAEEILPYIEEAFKQTTGKSLPKDFSLVLCDKDELKRAHQFFNGNWSDGIQGFCINRNGFGESRIFVKKDELAKVMLTVGHEIGHIQTSSLKGVEEEAKAFAFSMEWMNKIKENNIAGLESAIITEQPAQNGLHNVAFDFVANLLRQGMSALDVFNGLVQGMQIAC